MLDPFALPPPAEVPLERPPLVRAIAQVRFPLVASVSRLDFIGPFQEAIRKQYSTLREEPIEIVLGQGLTIRPASTPVVWRFLDATENWRVSLAPDFVALEVERYTSRGEFF